MTGSSDLSVGLEVESSADEEHAEAVVVAVSESAGDAAVEFDEAVDGFGAAVGRAAGFEVGQERGSWAVSRILDGFLGVFLRSSGCCCAVVGECLEWGSVAQG